MQQRYYDPELGRTLSRDPVTAFSSGDMRHFNGYAYAFNNPYRFTDPDGRSPVDDNPNHRPGGHWRPPVRKPPPPPPPEPPCSAACMAQRNTSDHGGTKAQADEIVAATGFGWFRPEGHDYKAGRVGHPQVSPGSPIGAFVDDELPAGHTMAVNHDRLVDYLTKKGFPDRIANIPTMLPAYTYSIGQETVNTNVLIVNYMVGTNIPVPFVHEDPP